MAATRIKLSATITRTYGAITASWGIEEEVTVTKRDDIIREYSRLHDHIKAEMFDFESTRLAKFPAPSGQTQQPSQGLPEANTPRMESEWMPLVSIHREIKGGGKAFYYAKPSSGKYMRHGAPLYWDTFQGIKLETFEQMQKDGVMEFDPTVHRIYLSEKPKGSGKFYATAFKQVD